MAVIIGYLVGRYIFKLNLIMLIGAICGGMTSTPGLGAAIEAVGSDEPAAGYVAIYPFALLGMVIFFHHSTQFADIGNIIHCFDRLIIQYLL